MGTLPRKHSLLILSGSDFKTSRFNQDQTLSDFDVTEVMQLSGAYSAAQLGTADCILVSGLIADLDSVEILETIHHANSTLPVVFYAEDMSAGLAVRLIRAGAHHCFDTNTNIDEFRDALTSAAAQQRSHERNVRERREVREPWRGILVGESRAMEAVAETIRLVGNRRCTVLISGETGTGKEMAARALHAASHRRLHPMVAVNCSALPENLLEAELFGHTKGAFTGAASARIGRFEQANKSTIFLDEIGDMPIDLQAKLLRVLQEREIQRLGSSDSIKIDVRIIAATNVDLQERIKQGKFREDLYYRLNVVPLQMPPLRKRASDIPALVSHFIEKICLAEDIPLKAITPETMRRLCTQTWPGNVRQLENAVEMAIAVSGDNDTLVPRDFGLTIAPIRHFPAQEAPEWPSAVDESVDFETAVSQFELAMLDSALRKTGGNKTAAAESLGMKRTTLIMKMRSFENNGLLLQKAG
ncbi:MAG TPA: sigma-54 dependent transcriptional regulator [Bryobacteraceae bacterium]|nr:sigma-54 dependent transcriptional regulator [Bryobacteraceae bacterium]